jgi:hypothetical protein
VRTRNSSLKRLVALFFIFLGCFLLVGGAGLLSAALLWHPADVPNAFDWKPPLEQIDNAALAPATVLLPLTGMDPTSALNAALDNANVENAYALIAYDTRLPDPTRIGALLQLGSRYTAAKLTRKAATCYQSAALLATLSPAISDSAREDTYLQASSSLRALGAADAARMLIDQAYLVAQFSPALRRDARARRLNQVADAYTALGASALAAQAHTKADDALTEPASSLTATVRAPFSPTFGDLPAAGDVDRYQERRIAAAKQLADDLTNNPPKTSAEWPQDSVGQLHDALVEEDNARQAYYDQQTALTQDTAVQAALWRDRVDWLALKYRIARGAFGIDLVPEWSKDSKTIAADWSDALTEFYRLQEAQAAALTAPADATQASEDILRRELIAARWGWLSGTSEQAVRNALAQIIQKRRDASATDLFLDTVTRNNRSVYLLLPDELYGQNEKALPR